MLHNTLYIETPFCPSICKYCIYHKGIGTRREVDEYFDVLLPKFLKRKEVKKILFSMDYLDVYFGGGTSNFATAKQWKRIFDLLPLKNCKVKCFEGAIRSFTKDHVRLCADYGFNYISIGIQSLSERILKKNNRYFAPVGKIQKLVKDIEDLNIICNLDLLCGIDKGDERDVPQFIQDLKFTMLEISPISITVNVKVSPDPRPLVFHLDVDSLPLRETLLKELDLLNPFGAYECVSGDLKHPLFEALLSQALIPEYRFMRDRKDFLFKQIGAHIMSEWYNFVHYNVYDIRKHNSIRIGFPRPTKLVKKIYRLFVNFRKSKKLPYY